MMNISFDDIQIAKASKYLSYSMVLAWGILCGESIYLGNWAPAITGFCSGVLMLFAAEEVYEARLIKHVWSDDKETFITVTLSETDTGNVVAAGCTDDVLTLCSAAARFGCEVAAQADFSNEEVAESYSRMFNTMLSLYAEKKGIDENELFELVGLRRLD